MQFTILLHAAFFESGSLALFMEGGTHLTAIGKQRCCRFPGCLPGRICGGRDAKLVAHLLPDGIPQPGGVCGLPRLRPRPAYLRRTAQPMVCALPDHFSFPFPVTSPLRKMRQSVPDVDSALVSLDSTSTPQDSPPSSDSLAVSLRFLRDGYAELAFPAFCRISIKPIIFKNIVGLMLDDEMFDANVHSR